MSFIDEIKKAAKEIEKAALEFAETAEEKTKEYAGKAKEKGKKVVDNVKDGAASKLEKTIADLNESLPIIEEAGYIMNKLDVDISLLPRLFAHFYQVKTVSEEKQTELLERVEGRKLITMLLKALFKASTLREKIKIKDMEYQEVAVEIGLTPSAKLVFRNTNYYSLTDKSKFTDPE